MSTIELHHDRSLFFFQAEDGIRDRNVTGVQTCALPISNSCTCSCWSKPFGREYRLLSELERTGLLCMAYGSPRTDADVEAYYTHIRGGRQPSPESLDELRERYRAIGSSPLEAITRRQAAALGTR